VEAPVDCCHCLTEILYLYSIFIECSGKFDCFLLDIFIYSASITKTITVSNTCNNQLIRIKNQLPLSMVALLFSIINFAFSQLMWLNNLHFLRFLILWAIRHGSLGP
jgi:hypothetical protein